MVSPGFTSLSKGLSPISSENLTTSFISIYNKYTYTYLQERKDLLLYTTYRIIILAVDILKEIKQGLHIQHWISLKLDYMQVIRGYRFDLDQKIRLENSKKKFWEVSIEGPEVHYRAGVLRGEQEHKIKEVNKNYESNILGKATIITKIGVKLDKGYYSETAEKVQSQNLQKKTIRRTRLNQKPSEIQETNSNTMNSTTTQKKRRASKKKKNEQTDRSGSNKEINKKFWKGLEKSDELIDFHVIGNQLKIVRRCGAQESSQIKNFSSFNEAIDFIHHQEEFYAKEGFTNMQSSAIIEQESRGQNTKENKLIGGQHKTERSLTNMTDNAMWKNSGINHQDQGQNVYINNPWLGPPIDHCIKCLLAQNYKEENDPVGWIMSQKLDGVRCLWTGQQMYSRNGNKFNFPNFFTKNWPKSQLDGELFIGRGKFSQTLSAVKKNVPIASQWENLKYLVFDAPGIRQPFKKRIKILQEQLSKIDNSFIKCHAHRSCAGFPDLFTELEKVNKMGGQGIMLRQPEAFYENKRSKNLQKVKTFHDDEAQIIGYTAGTGRCLGWVGSLKVRNDKGIEFEVGSGLNDELRQNPPAIGLKITYKYQQFNKESGKPRFPTYLRMYTGA